MQALRTGAARHGQTPTLAARRLRRVGESVAPPDPARISVPAGEELLIEPLTDLAGVLLAVGDAERAEALLWEALDIALGLDDASKVSRAVAGVGHAAAIRGDGVRAAELLGAADGLLRRSGSVARPGDRAACEAAAAAAREALGDDGQLAEAQRRGRRLTTAEAVALARGGQAALDDRVRLLTRREVEVAQLVAQGLTNRQIAETLIISHHTAERHVENILSKLELSSRVQVATWIAKARSGGSRLAPAEGAAA